MRTFVAAGACPERAETLRSKSILDPYVPYLRQRLTEGPTNASHLWRELQQRGFSGGYKVVARWLQAQGWQLQKGRSSQAQKLHGVSGAIPATENELMGEQTRAGQALLHQNAILREPLESPRHLVWLLLRDPARLNETEQHLLSFLRQEPTGDVAYTLAQHFVQLLREHRAEELDT